MLSRNGAHDGMPKSGTAVLSVLIQRHIHLLAAAGFQVTPAEALGHLVAAFLGHNRRSILDAMATALGQAEAQSPPCRSESQPVEGGMLPVDMLHDIHDRFADVLFHYVPAMAPHEQSAMHEALLAIVVETLTSKDPLPACEQRPTPEINA